MDDRYLNYAGHRTDERLKDVDSVIVYLDARMLRKLEYVKHILYQEPQLNADDMRDLAQLLEIISEEIWRCGAIEYR